MPQNPLLFIEYINVPDERYEKTKNHSYRNRSEINIENKRNIIKKKLL
jgi:hypothetical protein